MSKTLKMITVNKIHELYTWPRTSPCQHPTSLYLLAFWCSLVFGTTQDSSLKVISK